jgi:hypothetical protein
MDVLCRQSDRARSCRWGRAALAVAARGSASTVDMLAASVLATRGGALAVAARGGAPIVDLLAALGGERSHGGAMVGRGRKRRETRGEKKGGRMGQGSSDPAVSGLARDARGSFRGIQFQCLDEDKAPMNSRLS